jgi:hypothetical protein
MAIEEMMGEPSEVEVEEETVEIPTSILGGQEVTPGDVVRLEVVTLNGDSGTVTVKYSTPRKTSSIEEAASVFEE